MYTVCMTDAQITLCTTLYEPITVFDLYITVCKPVKFRPTCQQPVGQAKLGQARLGDINIEITAYAVLIQKQGKLSAAMARNDTDKT